jgi:hypothetical protein
MSFLDPGATLNGNSLFTLFVDWSSKEKQTVLYVAAGGETTSAPGPPVDSFNGVTVAASAKDTNGVYNTVSAINVVGTPQQGNRTYISFIAPGDQVELLGPGPDLNPNRPVRNGTSFAAPHVTSTVALLQQFAQPKVQRNDHGFSGNAFRHEVMKAVLINSADKIREADANLLPVGSLPVPAGGLLGMEKTVRLPDGDGFVHEAMLAQRVGERSRHYERHAGRWRGESDHEAARRRSDGLPLCTGGHGNCRFV